MNRARWRSSSSRSELVERTPLDRAAWGTLDTVPDDGILLYRGVSEGGTIRGASWTRSPSLAYRFAAAKNRSATVYSIVAQKRDVVAHINKFGEQEYVVDVPADAFILVVTDYVAYLRRPQKPVTYVDGSGRTIRQEPLSARLCFVLCANPLEEHERSWQKVD